MLGIVFQDLACGNSFKNLIKCDALLNHFLLGVLCDAKVLHISLSAYPFQHSLQVSDISFIFRNRHWMKPSMILTLSSQCFFSTVRSSQRMASFSRG